MLSFSSILASAATVTMYAADGRSKQVVDVTFSCYDASGNKTKDYSHRSADINISFHASAFESIDSDNSCGGSTTLFNNSKTKSISWPKVTEVEFKDGTTWKR